MTDREVLYVETDNENYSIVFGRTGFKRALEKEKRNPEVVLIKRVKLGQSSGRVLYVRRNDLRSRVERNQICDSSN